MTDRDNNDPLEPITGDDEVRERFDEAAEQARQPSDDEAQRRRQQEAAERAGSNPRRQN